MTGLPRWTDASLALGGLLATWPVLLLAAAVVRLTSRGPALFRQIRIGRGGRPFTLLKLRTMKSGKGSSKNDGQRGGSGGAITTHGDRRITPVGRVLRRTKLDELPQLWNVLSGDLALVGPRPEVPEYVDLDDPLWQKVLSVRPGLTDPVTLRLRREDLTLAALEKALGGEAETLYRRHLQPWKLRGYARYLERRSAGSDLRCLLATVLSPLGLSFGFEREPPTSEELLAASDGSAASAAPASEG